MHPHPPDSDSDDDLAALYPQKRPGPPPEPAEGKLYVEPDSLESSLFRNEVVPEEDNPLRGWRRWGAEMLPRDLWPREAITNPVMVYFNGRQRGRAAEDFYGLSVWLFLFLIKSWLFFRSTSMTVGFVYSWLEIFLLPAVLALYTGALLGVHIRGSLMRLPLEQLMTTPLKPEDIVQGLTIRPLAVQAFGSLTYCIASFLMIIAASFYHYEQPGWAEFFYIIFGLPMLGMFNWAAIQTGGAFGARVNFCIRDAQMATLRLGADLLREFLLVVFLPAVVLVSLFVFSAFFQICILVILFLGGAIFLAALYSQFISERSQDAMHWVCTTPEEWWVYGDDEHDRVSARIGMFGKWDRLEDVTPEEYRQSIYD